MNAVRIVFLTWNKYTPERIKGLQEMKNDSSNVALV